MNSTIVFVNAAFFLKRIIDMKKIICAAVLLLLTGCSSRAIDNWELRAVQSMCAEHGGVDYFDPALYRYRCNDGELGDYSK